MRDVDAPDRGWVWKSTLPCLEISCYGVYGSFYLRRLDKRFSVGLLLLSYTNTRRTYMLVLLWSTYTLSSSTAFAVTLDAP